MKTSYQEQIMDKFVQQPSNGNISSYGQNEYLNAIKDCFAISRIESEINELGSQLAFGKDSRTDYINKCNELDEILTKYGIKAE